eukprot:m.107951 g.107951  ORF g.107951 m.107951 type:complete len:160 (-) comp16937_c0_seq2:230-709(-)
MPAVRGARIHWQSSIRSNGHVGIIDPITDIDPALLKKPQKVQRYPPTEPLSYPTPTTRAQIEKSAREKALGGMESELSATASAKKVGLSHSATLEAPAFNNTSMATSSFPKPISPVKTVSCNFGDPNRRHNPHGTRGGEGTTLTSEVLPNGSIVNFTRS